MSENNSIKTNNQLKITVLHLEDQIKNTKEGLRQIYLDKSTALEEYFNKTCEEGFREKYLGGKFWGNRDLVKRISELKENIPSYKSKISSKQVTIKALDVEIKNTIDDYLGKTDTQYSQTKMIFRNIQTIKKETERCMECIIDNQSESYNTRSLRIYSVHQAIELRKYVGFLKAQPAEELKRLGIYRDIKKLQYTISPKNKDRSIDMLWKLESDTKNTLERLKSYIEGVQEIINRQYSVVEKDISARILVTRRLLG